MPKLPAFQFYTGDWLKDPQLSMCRPATRGIWMDAISAMHELDRCGQLSGTLDTLARVCRCRSDELASAINDLESTGAADVTRQDANVTVINRRMRREFLDRKSACERKKRQRSRECDGEVTQKSRSPSSSSSSTSVNPSDSPAPPAEPEPADPPLLIFPTHGPIREWGLTQAKVDQYRETFPSLDVVAECRRARQWCIDNKTCRKTARGMPAFLSRWLSNAQDRPLYRDDHRAAQRQQKPAPKPSNTQPEFLSP